GIQPLAADLFRRNSLCRAEVPNPSFWSSIFFIEHARSSQFDVIDRHARTNHRLPHGICSVAGSGENFHGHKNRTWVSIPGNLHMSIYFSPQQHVDHFGVGFTILSAISVVQALDALQGLRKKPMIRWVNDILLDNAKVGGVLACTHSCGAVVAGAVLGIGLNVSTTPPVVPTPFVPEVTSIAEFLPEGKTGTLSLTFEHLLRYLEQNYHLLLSGHYARLLEFYRERSLLIGKDVRVFADAQEDLMDELAHGTVTSIGTSLELMLDNSTPAVTKGRVVLNQQGGNETGSPERIMQ
ncbi:MAG: hypothetical protein KAJ12_09425, partial [Bacteroidetes bacterium]|nr:hypothetical protein [Bacteroidota bacterium]